MVGTQREGSQRPRRPFLTRPITVVISQITLVPAPQHLPGVGALGGEQIVFCFDPYYANQKAWTGPSGGHGVWSRWSTTWKSQIIQTLQALPFTSKGAKKRRALPSPQPRSHPEEKPTHPSVIQLFRLAHNHRKRAELLSSPAAHPDPESPLKRRDGPGFPSLPVKCR